MQTLNRTTIAHLYKILIPLNSRLKKPPQFQFYCTAAATTNADIIDSTNGDSIVTHPVDDSDSNINSSVVENSTSIAHLYKIKTKNRKPKQTLYANISPFDNPSDNITSIIDEWVKDGKQVRFAELQRITRDLRKCCRYSQALQVYEWMKSNEAFTFSPVEHAVQIVLIGKVHGYVSAESYFNNLSEADKTEKTYGALLHCYVRECETVKALSHLQSMKEKGLLSCLAYNDIMTLYTHTEKYEKVPDVLSEMKEVGVSPDIKSYKICLNSYGQRSDIKGMEILLEEMERQPDICIDWMTCWIMANFYSKEGLIVKANDFLKRAEEMLPVGDVNGYNHLITLHANLGNISAVLKLWSLKKNTCRTCVKKDYINILNTLVRMNEVEEAKKVLEEWESSGNYDDGRIPCILIDKYIEKRQYEKAKTMLEDLMEKGKLLSADSWGKIVAGHLDLGNTVRAVECMKDAISVGKEKKWKPECSLITRLLDVLGVEESTSDIDTLIDTFLTATNGSVRVKPPQFQFYCTAAATATNADSDSNSNSSKPRTKKRKLRQNFYSKTSPLGNPSVNNNMTSLIDQWVKDGKKVRFAELQRIIRDLRKRSRYSQALQVSEWMRNSEDFTFSSIEHAVQIDLIGKVHGYVSAESYFNNLSEADKTEKTYGALLHCYVSLHETFKSLSLLQSMKKKGIFSCLAYNDIMTLYSHTGKYEKVLDVLSQMKEDGVTPDNTSYQICLKSYIQRSDIKGMEILLDEMERHPDIRIDWMTCGAIANFYAKDGFIVDANDFLKQAEERLPVGDAIGYNRLITLHANLGNKSEVLRLWSLEKNTCKKHHNRDYINILSNLMRINEVEEAEKVHEEWESSGNFYDGRIPCIVIDKYIENGQYAKAETILDALMKKGKLLSADRWGIVVAGHLDLGDTTSAVKCMEAAISFGKAKKWKPEHSLIIRLLNVLGVKESTSDIDTLIDTFLRDTFLKAVMKPSQVDSSDNTRLKLLGLETRFDLDQVIKQRIQLSSSKLKLLR